MKIETEVRVNEQQAVVTVTFTPTQYNSTPTVALLDKALVQTKQTVIELAKVRWR